MRTRTRDRVQRILCGALLNSDLSDAELRQVIDTLSGPDAYDFTLDFGKLMRTILGEVLKPHAKQSTSRVRESSDVEKTAYHWIQRRRLSKKEVLQIIHETIGSASAVSDSDRPIRDLLRSFFDIASAVDAQRFLARLQPRDSDPYLEGILKRK